LSCAIAGASAQTVGTAAAVNPTSSSIQPGGGGRVLQIGQSVVYRERVTTSASGSLQVLFVDKTTLNVGPNSDLTIDEFVYNPAVGSGRMTTSLARGVLRFVGGNISHQGGATIKTPVATLGIRGGVVTVTHDRNGTRVVLGFGTVVVATATGSVTLRRPGFAVSVSPDGVLGSTTDRVQQAEVDQGFARTRSLPGQSGGARQRPTEAIAARAGVGVAYRSTLPCTLPLQGQNLGDIYDFRCQAIQPSRQGADTLVRQGVQLERDRPRTGPARPPTDPGQPPANEPRPSNPSTPLTVPTIGALPTVVAVQPTVSRAPTSVGAVPPVQVTPPRTLVSTPVVGTPVGTPTTPTTPTPTPPVGVGPSTPGSTITPGGSIFGSTPVTIRPLFPLIPTGPSPIR
jgi:hypothetical protein